MPQTGIRSEKDRDALRKARAEEQAKQQQAMEMKEAAKLAPSLGKTPEAGSFADGLGRAMQGDAGGMQ
jgi:hypothetical protein